MQKTTKAIVTMLAVTVLFSLGAVAGEKAQSTAWVKLYEPGTINGTEVKAGEYLVKYGENEAVFFKGKMEVARTPMLLEKVSNRFDRDSVVYLGQSVSEIRFAGKKSKLVLSPGAVAARSTEKTAKSNQE